jgi:cell division initiation protein
MKISPMDIQRQAFSRRWRGFDRDEVRTYLTLVAEEVAGLQRERDAFEQEMQNLRALVDEHRQREQILKNTLLTAQKLSEEIREGARRQAEAVVREAEVQADRLIELAQNRAHEVERGIVDLRAQRAALRTDVRAIVERLSTLLDLQEEAEGQNDGNLHFLVRRREEA